MANDRKTLGVRLTLDGVADVQRAFADMGKSGSDAAKKITDAFAKVGIGDNLKAQINAIRVQFASVVAAGARFAQSFGTMRLAVQTFGVALLNVVRNLAIVKGAIVGVATAMGLLAKGFADNADRIHDQAAGLGLTQDQYQRLATAASNTGIEQGKLDSILAKFTIGVEEAGDESDKAADKIGRVPKALEQIAVKGADGAEKLITIRRGAQEAGAAVQGFAGVTKKGADGLQQYAANLLKAKTTQEQLAIVARDFGKKGAAETLTFLRNLAFQFDDNARAAAGLIQPLSDVELAIGVDLKSAFNNLGTNLKTIKDRLSAVFAPAITEAVKLFTKLIRDNEKTLIEWTRFIAVEAIGVVFDFIQALNGFDQDVERQWILDARDAFVAFGRAVRFVIFDVVIPAFNAIREGAEFVAKKINDLFGTHFTGDTLLATLAIVKLVGGFALLTSALGLALGAIQLFAHGLTLIGGTVNLVLLALRPIAFLLGFLGAAIGAALGVPAAVGVAVVAALAALAVAIFVFWDEISAGAKVAFEKISEVAAKAIKDIQDGFAELQSIGSDLAKGDFASAFEKIKVVGLRALDELIAGLNTDVDNINAILKPIGIDTSAVWEGIKSAAETSFEGLKTVLAADVASINNLLRLIGIDGPAIWRGIEDATATSWQAIKSVVSSDISEIKGLVNGIDFADIWATTRARASEAFDTIKRKAGEAFGVVSQVFSGDFSGAFAGIKQAGADAFDTVRGAAEGAFNGLRDAVNAIGPALGPAWETIKIDARAAWDTIVEAAKTLPDRLKSVWELIKSGAATIFDGIAQVAKKAWDGVVAVVTEAGRLVSEAVGKVARAALDAWSGASQSVADSAKAITDAISRATDIAGDVQGAEALAAALVKPFDDAKTRIEKVLADIAAAAQRLPGQIGEALDQIQEVGGSSGSNELPGGAGSDQLGAPAGATGGLAQTIADDFAAANQQIIATWNATLAALTAAAGAGAQAIGSAFAAIPAALLPVWEAIRSGAASLWTGVVETASASWALVLDVVSAAGESIRSAWAGVMSGIVSLTASMVASVRSLISSLRASLESLRASIQAAKAAASSSGSSEFAAGGRVLGPGTGTSDSIPALLSNGEYVIRATMVERFGPLIEAINSGRYTMAGLFKTFRASGFAMGGIVERLRGIRFDPGALQPVLRLAGGGAVPERQATASLRPVSLVLPGGQTVEGFQAPDSAITQIGKYAARKYLASGGRKPAWYGA